MGSRTYVRIGVNFNRLWSRYHLECLYSSYQLRNENYIGQRRNLKSRLFKELNQPIDYTPKYTFKR